MRQKIAKPIVKKTEEKYGPFRLGEISENDFKTLERFAKSTRTSKVKYYKDLRRACEFAVNQLDLRPGVYLIKFLVCYKEYRDIFEKCYCKVIVKKWWKAFSDKFGSYIINDLKDNDYSNFTEKMYHERNPR